jgi:hypothetical protein
MIEILLRLLPDRIIGGIRHVFARVLKPPGEIVAVDIGHGNSGLGQQRAAFRQNVGKTAKDHVAFGLAFRGQTVTTPGLMVVMVGE